MTTKKTNQITPTSEITQTQGETQRGNSPAEMIRMAVTGGADLDKLEKLLTLQERWEANEAKKAYHKAMAAFKANPPTILKDKSVSFGAGKASYKHASLNNVCEEINKSMSPHGLSASWRVSQNGAISVTCKITHEFGHSEETTLAAPSDTSGSKNAIQAIGSTITYLERYTLLALVGLATSDQDEDGNAAGKPEETVTEEQLSTLIDYIASTKTDSAKFLKYLGVENLDDLPKSLFPKALNALKQKEAKNARPSN